MNDAKSWFDERKVLSNCSSMTSKKNAINTINQSNPVQSINNNTRDNQQMTTGQILINWRTSEPNGGQMKVTYAPVVDKI
jgi:hypothetical protein